jgi:type IV pilus assembly protein PilY1
MQIRLLGGLCLGGALIVATHTPARAQLLDVNPAPPNVLILLDTSGSMERMIDGRDPDQNNTYGGLGSACNPGTQTEPNRWGVALQALTGDIQPFYSCVRMSRATGKKFVDEYSITAGGTLTRPYDTDYFLPYHRPVSMLGGTYAPGPPATVSGGTACVLAPWKLPGTTAAGDGVGNPSPQGDQTVGADRWSLQGLGAFPLDLSNAADPGITVAKNQANLCDPTASDPTAGFSQYANGFLDAGRDIVRFGLMTFDQDPGFGTGMSFNAGQMVVAPTFLPSPAPACGGGPTCIPNPAPSNVFDGQWSYFPNWDNTGWAGGTQVSWGQLASCNKTQYDVGARNTAAPPWEGRMVKFPGSTATVADLQRNNDRIKKIIAATRPYGATPIVGMLKDAQEYFWNDPTGPQKSDPYVNPSAPGGPGGTGGCRDQYIILLTDGAPNLDLIPNCEAGGTCPFGNLSASGNKAKSAEYLAWELYQGGQGNAVTGPPAGTNRSVKTFVVGFAVSGNNATYATSFPGGYTTCSAFAASGATFQTACANPAANGILPGSGAEACCQLEKIARAGQGFDPYAATATNKAYFADDANSLKNALNAILNTIASGVTTRSIPAYSASSLTTGGTGTAYFDTFTAQFSPSKTLDPTTGLPIPWSGTILRRRGKCDGTFDTGPTLGTEDDYQAVTSFGSTDSARRIITVAAANTLAGSARDSMNTIRPFAPAGNPDGIGTYAGAEVGADFTTLDGALTPQAFNITASSCKGSKRFGSGTTTQTLTANECKQVALGFAMARDPGLGGKGWALPASRDGAADSARLGGIFHSSPVLSPPPSALLRDDSYLAFKNNATFATRKSMLYVESTDGLLHAYATRDTASVPPGGAIGTNFESFAFIPPMVLPGLLSNYPGGQHNLLDGSPVVKDIIYARGASPGYVGAAAWRTVLVSGCGRGNCGGYFAMDVTKPDITTFTAASPSPGNPPAQTTGNPHFLWQLTTVPHDGTAQGVQSTIHPKDNGGTVQYTLFGRETPTPAITTVFIDTDSDGKGDTEVGVAILPGGIDGPPKGVAQTPDTYSDSTGGYCKRATSAGLYGTTPPAYNTARSWYDFRPVANHTARAFVRKWGTTCQDGVPGRSVAVVRIDTGEVLRVFARNGTVSGVPAFNEAPHALTARNRVNDTPLDSPMTGTPVVYPSGVGEVAKQFYIGDADGTIWKFDISNPNPDQWKGGMYYDVYNDEALVKDATAATFSTSVDTPQKRAEASQPVQVLPNISLDPSGNIVLHVATGDLENFTSKHFTAADLDEADPTDKDDETNKVPIFNYLVAIREKFNSSDQKMHAFNIDSYSAPTDPLNTWRHFFVNGERLAGPFVVFDRFIYYVTWKPATALVCGANAGDSVVYGRDYLAAKSTCTGISDVNGCGGAHAGGAFAIPGSIVVDAAYGPPFSGLASGNPKGKLVPGLFLQATPACAAVSSSSDPYVGGTSYNASVSSSGTYKLMLPVGAGGSGAGGADLPGLSLAAPRTPTRVDSWATVVD